MISPFICEWRSINVVMVGVGDVNCSSRALDIRHVNVAK